MKKTGLSLLGLATALLAGCIVTSVYPFYTAKDLTFEPALLGVWSDPDKPDDKESWIFEKLTEQTYKLTVRDKNETNEFGAHLFTLDGQKFLDCLNRQRSAYAAPTHVLLRVQQIQPQLETRVLDYEWLTKLVEAKPKAIRHIVAPNPIGDPDDKGLLTLTADTAKLQKFIREHLNTAAAWKEHVELEKR